jgi:transposase
MKQAGMTNRAIARETGYDRERISAAYSRYCGQRTRLEEPGADVKAIQEEMNADPKYDSSRRVRTKYTAEVDARLREIVEAETAKTRRLGARHKQRLTNKQIHAILEREGYDIGRVTINIELTKIRKRLKEVYIRQEYDFGDRLEYDFGEVKLDCGDGLKVYHMAVFSSPASGFRWAFLYTNQKKDVFMDSHVKFFKMTGGVWREVVYDNMRNVVTKFIGRNEKELNPELILMASYYGYQLNVTNCYKGNEKGHVENSVKVLRNQVFSERYKFASLDEAQAYLHSRLLKLGEGCAIEEEKKCLLPYMPPYELATISEHTVDTYSFICVNTAFYSVPEYLVCKKVIVKKYHDEIRVFAGNELVCTHKRIFGNGSMSVDIHHYLNTLLKKPGAIRNSVALKSVPKLKAIFDTHYSKQPKKFIELFLENRNLPIDGIIRLFEEKTTSRAEIRALDVVKPVSSMDVASRAAMSNYAALIMKADTPALREVAANGDGAGTCDQAAVDVHTRKCG